MSRNPLPLARNDGLTVQPLDGEMVVYDNETDKAYVLSPSAAAVWKACNGTRTVRELAEYLSLSSPTNEQTVWYALGQLNDLLQEPVALPPEMVGMSRRRFLKMTGAVTAGVAIPLVIKMVAPSPAQAQSGSGIACCVCETNIFTLTDCSSCESLCTPYGGVVDCQPQSCVG